MKKPVVHFEIGCSDLPATVDFYKNIFDWDIVPNGHSAVINTGGEGAIPGHLNQLTPEETQKYITIYIETDTLEEDLKKIDSSGGKVLVPPIELPDGRSFAWFEDVAGNTVGLITPSS